MAKPILAERLARRWSPSSAAIPPAGRLAVRTATCISLTWMISSDLSAVFAFSAAALHLAHDAVFGGQIFVPRQQLLVHRPRYVGQDARPIHNGPPAPPLARSSLIVQKSYWAASGTSMPTSLTDRLLDHFSFLTLRAGLNRHTVGHIDAYAIALSEVKTRSRHLPIEGVRVHGRAG